MGGGRGFETGVQRLVSMLVRFILGSGFLAIEDCTYGLVNRSPAPGVAYDLTAEGTALYRRQSILDSRRGARPNQHN